MKTLSGGQQRRLDLGLGIIGDPELLFLDEPTTGFDPSARRGAWDLVRALTTGGTTVILTTHYMDEVEALSNRVAVMNAGRIVAEGTPQSLGGRDLGEVADPLPAPAGRRSPANYPFRPRLGRGGILELRTDREVEALADAHHVGAPGERAVDRSDRRTPDPRGRLPAPDRLPGRWRAPPIQRRSADDGVRPSDASGAAAIWPWSDARCTTNS